MFACCKFKLILALNCGPGPVIHFVFLAGVAPGHPRSPSCSLHNTSQGSNEARLTPLATTRERSEEPARCTRTLKGSAFTDEIMEHLKLFMRK
ncbi:unnamed protein product [Arctogadus glacialis]